MMTPEMKAKLEEWEKRLNKKSICSECNNNFDDYVVETLVAHIRDLYLVIEKKDAALRFASKQYCSSHTINLEKLLDGLAIKARESLEEV